MRGEGKSKPKEAGRQKSRDEGKKGKGPRSDNTGPYAKGHGNTKADDGEMKSMKKEVIKPRGNGKPGQLNSCFGWTGV